LAKVEWRVSYIEKTRRIMEKIVIKNNNAITFINKKLLRYPEKATRTALLLNIVT